MCSPGLTLYGKSQRRIADITANYFKLIDDPPLTDYKVILKIYPIDEVMEFE